jgi:hypothetical protein
MTPSFWPNGAWLVGEWPSNIWPNAPQTPVAVGTRMSHATFPFAAKFSSLYNNSGKSQIVDFACSVIETEWNGIFTLWANDPAQVQKQTMAEAYLVGWWLTDMYPEDVDGVQGDGGMPLTSKSIGGVSITRKDLGLQAGMKQLESNAFGVKAAHLLMTAPERMGIVSAQAAKTGQLTVPLVFPGWPS